MQKEITIYDIAKELHLSASTVSRALQDNKAISKETRKKVVKHAEHMGYRSNAFASNLRRKKTNTIGVIVPRLDSSFMSSCLAGMEEVANNSGYNLLISQSLEDSVKEAKNAKTFFDNRVDGLIVSLAINGSNLNHFNRFFSRGIPVVFFDRVPGNVDATCIMIDNYKAAFLATNHLIDQDCKRVVHVTLNKMTSVYAEREAGFLAAMHVRGKEGVVLRLEDLSFSEGFKIADTIAKMDLLPDGVFVANDMAAVGIMIRLQELSFRVPQSIAIVGFNNEQIAVVARPKLTSIDYPGREAGIAALRNMLEKLDNKENTTNRKVVLDSSIVIRESSKRS
jgi:LacI family transcriptional regulator